MARHCVHCSNSIDGYGTIYCSPECKTADKRERLAWRRKMARQKKHCPACGRRNQPQNPVVPVHKGGSSPEEPQPGVDTPGND